MVVCTATLGPVSAWREYFEGLGDDGRMLGCNEKDSGL